MSSQRRVPYQIILLLLLFELVHIIIVIIVPFPFSCSATSSPRVQKNEYIHALQHAESNPPSLLLYISSHIHFQPPFSVEKVGEGYLIRSGWFPREARLPAFAFCCCVSRRHTYPSLAPFRCFFFFFACLVRPVAYIHTADLGP